MKKLYIILAIAAAFAVAACEKKPVDNPDPKDPDPIDNPDPEEPTYVAPIKIDGDFADWNALDASKVSIAECAPDAPQKGLKVLKVYMDEVYMFVYFEFDPESVPDRSVVQCHTYFNIDNDESTGGCANQWVPGCIEYMTEGSIIKNEAFASYDPSLSIWVGDPGAQGWEWESVMPSGSGLYTGKGSGAAYEMSLLREGFPELGEAFQFGMDIQQNWNSVGILPNANLSDENPTGKSGLLPVKIDK